MKKILLFGAGRSSAFLIKYLATNAAEYHWQITIADINLTLLQEKIQVFPHIQPLVVDIFNTDSLEEVIKTYDLIISLLPPKLHLTIAEICLKTSKNLLTASYISPEMQQMHEEAMQKRVLFLNEMGLDPGIDHLSAMQLLDKLRQENKKIVSFKSFCGGLVAPEADTNPWHYKFTWNPQNVVLAGQASMAQYLEEKQTKFIPYHQLFKRIEPVFIEEYGEFEAYPNRDSLNYKEAYGLQEADTILRGTIRKKGYCEAWNLLIQLGMTDNGTIIQTNNLTYKQFTASFLPAFITGNSLEEKIANYLQISLTTPELRKLQWLGLFEDVEIPLNQPATPAQILQQKLEICWQLQPEDKDMIVMQHQIVYQDKEEFKTIVSDMAVIGENSTYTAMAKTVGLPLGIAAKLILTDKISQKGVIMPIYPEIYNPVLQELETYGIIFKEKLL